MEYARIMSTERVAMNNEGRVQTNPAIGAQTTFPSLTTSTATPGLSSCRHAVTKSILSDEEAIA